MIRNWENEFSQWARPPGKTEDERCENAIKTIRNAINKSDKLKNRNRLFVADSTLGGAILGPSTGIW